MSGHHPVVRVPVFIDLGKHEFRLHSHAGISIEESMDVVSWHACSKYTPAIAQLVEHLTVDSAEIRWSLVRFRVAGF